MAGQSRYLAVVPDITCKNHPIRFCLLSHWNLPKYYVCVVGRRWVSVHAENEQHTLCICPVLLGLLFPRPAKIRKVNRTFPWCFIMNSSLTHTQVWHVLTTDHTVSPVSHPHVYSHILWAIPVYSQSQSITTLWLTTHFLSHWGWQLSLPGLLVTYQDGLPACIQSLIPALT